MNPKSRLTLGNNPDGSLAALLEDCADAATDALMSGPVWTRSDFNALRDQVAATLTATTLAALPPQLGNSTSALNRARPALARRVAVQDVWIQARVTRCETRSVTARDVSVPVARRSLNGPA